MSKLICVLACSPVFLASCVQRSPSPDLNQLSQRVKAQQMMISDLQEKNRNLHEELKLAQARSHANYRYETVDVPPKTGEHFLYAKVIESYQANKPDDLNRAVEMLQRAYPESVFLDNAFYLAGLQQMQAHDWTQAQIWFSRVANQFPFGDKVPSALFAEAIAYRHLGELSRAEQLLRNVQKMYPGSAEAQRAVVEMQNTHAEPKLAAHTEKGWVQ